MKVAVRRVQLSSLGRMGCLLGVVAASLPSLLCGLLGVGVSRIAHDWLQGWQEVAISVLGQRITTLDFVQLLGLEGVLDTLQTVAGASVAVLLLSVLGLAIASGLVLALITILVGLSYNVLSAATGGIIVEMERADQEPPPE